MADVSSCKVETAFNAVFGHRREILRQQLSQDQLLGKVLGANGGARKSRTASGEQQGHAGDEPSSIDGLLHCFFLLIPNPRSAGEGTLLLRQFPLPEDRLRHPPRRISCSCMRNKAY